MPGKDIINIFIYIVILTQLSVRVGLGILILILNTEREITTEREIKLFNSIITSGSFCLTDTKIDEKRD